MLHCCNFLLNKIKRRPLSARPEASNSWLELGSTCQTSLVILILLCQHRLIRMQEGDAPINDGKCCTRRLISERETKHSSSKWGPRKVRLQSSASVVASLLFPSVDSLANTRGDSRLGTCVPLTPCLFFITGLAGERLPT